MSDDFEGLAEDTISDVEKLSRKTSELLVEDGKELLNEAKESTQERTKELSKSVMDWKLRAIKEDDEELKARYEHEYEVAKAALATSLIDEKLVLSIAARDRFMARFNDFLDGAVAILKKSALMGVKIAASTLAGAFGSSGVAATIVKNL